MKTRNTGPGHRSYGEGFMATAPANRSFKTRGRHTGNFRVLHELEREISAISLTPRQETPFHKDQSNSREVIEVSG